MKLITNWAAEEVRERIKGKVLCGRGRAYVFSIVRLRERTRKGVDGGRIIKLAVRRDAPPGDIARFDGGWGDYEKPADWNDEERKVVGCILAKFNGAVVKDGESAIRLKTDMGSFE